MKKRKTTTTTTTKSKAIFSLQWEKYSKQTKIDNFIKKSLIKKNFYYQKTGRLMCLPVFVCVSFGNFHLSNPSKAQKKKKTDTDIDP